MKKLFQLTLFVVAFVLDFNNLAAHDFEVDGVYYRIVNETIKTCNVTFRGEKETEYENEYSGDITIPQTVTFNGIEFVVLDIDSYAMYKCTELTSVVINAEISSIGDYAFYGCTGLSKISLGNTVSVIGKYSFNKCKSLKSITFPKSLTKICEGSFYDCIFDSIYSLNATPPSLYYNVTYIEFSGSYFPSKTYSFNNWDAIVYIPKGSLELYTSNSDKWGKFTNIVEIDDNYAEDNLHVILTVEYPESAIIKHQYAKDTSAKLGIIPAEGWALNTVAFDGVDISGSIDEEGFLITPELVKDSRINIVTVKVGEGTDGSQENITDKVKIFVENKVIKIFGAAENSVVAVSDLSGNSIYCGTDKEITLYSSGVFLINIEGATYKFIVF